MHELSLQKKFKNLQKEIFLIEVQLTLIIFVGSRKIQSIIFRAQNQSFTAVCPAGKYAALKEIPDSTCIDMH